MAWFNHGLTTVRPNKGRIPYTVFFKKVLKSDSQSQRRDPDRDRDRDLDLSRDLPRDLLRDLDLERDLLDFDRDLERDLPPYIRLGEKLRDRLLVGPSAFTRTKEVSP